MALRPSPFIVIKLVEGRNLFVAVLTLYLALPTRMLYWDGAGFAMAVDHPGWFTPIEPNHPIYIGAGWGVHALARLVAPAILGLTVCRR
jgi:hypothetical protein